MAAKNIYNNNSNTLLSGTSGNDTIWNGADGGGTNVTIDAGAGDDTIENDGSNVTISGGAGKDTILNDNAKVKISGDAGDDEIYNTFSDIGGGDDVTINGGTGDDTIQNEYGGDNLKINSGAGNDSIINGGGSKATITGGADNDKISLDSGAKNTVIKYAEGDGNDTIRGFNSDDTLYITKGSYSTVVSGNDFIVNVGSGKIILKNALADGNSIKIKNSSGKVITYNDAKVINGSVENNVRSNVTLAGSKKADTIGNSGEKVLITGQAGNDLISNRGNNVTISGGAGNDTIYNGNDSIFNGVDKVTINADAGNDYISNNMDYEFSDVLMNGGSGKDTIYIDGGGETSDVIVNIKNVTIDGGADDDVIRLAYFESGSNISINGGAGNDTIYNDFGNATITGGKGNDKISLDNINEDYSADNLIQYAAGDGNDTIIGFNDDDTLQITSGSYETAKSGTDFVVTVGKQKITFKNADTKINIQDSLGNVITYNDWKVWEGSIENNTKSNVTLAGSDEDDTIGNDAYGVLITGQAGNDSIWNNWGGENVTIDGGAGNDSISLDSAAKNNVIQFAADGGNDTVFGFDYDDTLQITSGDYTTEKVGTDLKVAVGENSILLKDVLVGGYEKIKIADSSGSITTYNDWKVWNGSIESNIYSGVTLAGSNKADTIGNDAYGVLITGQAGNDYIYNDGDNVTINAGTGNDDIFNGSDGENVSINGGTGNDTIENYGSNVTIDAGSGNDSIRNGTSNVTIDGGAGNDKIKNYGSNVTIDGGAGNDKIKNYGSNVTIDAGAGNDKISLDSSAENNLIQYAAGDGNDTIRGFNKDDTLYITEGSYTTAKSGKDFVVKVGENSILLKNALAKGYEKIKIADSSGSVTTYNDWKVWNGSIENNVYSNVTLAGSKKADTIKNCADNVLITGGAGNDLIDNGAYRIDGSVCSGGENVTINGGKGDDTVYIYNTGTMIQYAAGDGNDTIYNFNADDTLQITSGSYQTSVSGSDVIVTIGTGKITLKYVLGSIKNSSANMAELFEENNFATAGNISDITDIKIVGEFENTEEKITQENLITFAK